MRGLNWVAGALAAGAMVVLPAGALAHSGWRLHHFSAGSSYSASGTATLCSASEFGRYSFHASGTVQTSSGTRTFHERGWVDLLNNHAPNRIHVRSVGGTMFNGYSASERAAVKQAVKSDINNNLRVEILAVHGRRLKLQAFYRGHPYGHAYSRRLHRVSC